MANQTDIAEQKLASILAISVACRNTTEFTRELLPAICQKFAATTAVMHYYAGDHKSGRYYDPVYVNIDPVFLDEFRTRFSTQDPFPLAALHKFLNGEGCAFSSDQLVDMAELRDSEFYRDFLRPQNIEHMLVVVIARGDSPFAFLGIHRDKEGASFSQDEIEVANRLGPYLSAVADRVHMADELSLYKRALDSLSYGLMNKGVLVLDQHLSLIFANDYACQSLAEHPQFNAEHRSYPEEIADASKQLFDQEDGLSAISSANFALSINEMEINGYVRPSTNDDDALLFLAFFNSDQFGVLNPRACEEFGLTERELDVTRCVIEGKTNSEIADELHISVRTVQNHLRSIFAKCDVHNRTSLSNRILSLS